MLLIQVTDTHCFASDETRLPWTDWPVYPNRSLRAVLERVALLKPAAVVLSGDLAQEESAGTYRRIVELLAGFPAPVYALPGNHDDPRVMRAELGEDRMPEVVVLGAWHLVFLDSHVDGEPYGLVGAASLMRLHAVLEQVPPDEFVAVFVHHHPVDIGSAWMDEMGLKNRDSFWRLVSDCPSVRAVFHGHAHQEFSRMRGHVAVYGTPATCVQARARTEKVEFEHARPGWREIELFEDGRVGTRVGYLDDLVDRG